MSDYISKEYITEHIKACWINGRPKHTPELHEVLSWVDEVPPEDVQPVVYCSECANNYSTPHNPMCDYMNAHLWPDSFCSNGKRKGEDNEID